MKWILIVFTIILACVFAKSDKCRILSFGSGVEKVPYQVGALKAMIENMEPEDVQYDVISGVSFGAFNAAMVSVHKKGNEKAMIEELEGIWKKSDKITAYQNWWFGPAQGAISKGGLYDNTPWEAYLKKTLKGRGATRMMTLGAVDVANGDYVDLADLITTEKLEQAVYAATALNVFFPPVTEFGRDWFDGSGIWPVEVIGPIARCEKMGYNYTDIVVDVLMTTSDVLPERNSTNDSTIPSVLRYLEISEFYSGVNGIKRAVYGFPEINFRHCVSPDEKKLPTSWFPFDFKQKKVDSLLERGYSDAMEVMNMEPGQSCHDVIQKYEAKRAPKPPMEFGSFLKGEIS